MIIKFLSFLVYCCSRLETYHHQILLIKYTSCEGTHKMCTKNCLGNKIDNGSIEYRSILVDT